MPSAAQRIVVSQFLNMSFEFSFTVNFDRLKQKLQESLLLALKLKYFGGERKGKCWC